VNKDYQFAEEWND